jgi:hypothetical protein
MDALSPESKVLYDKLKADTAEIYEAKFASYKKEMLDAVKVFIDDTNSQIKGITVSLDTFHGQVEADIEYVKMTLGHDLSAVQHSLSVESTSTPANKRLRKAPSDLKGTAKTCTIGGWPVHLTRLLRSEVCLPTVIFF